MILHPDQEDIVSARLSGILNAANGLGMALGPLLGALLYDLVGFRLTMALVACAILCHAVFYVITADGCGSFKRSWLNRHKEK